MTLLDEHLQSPHHPSRHTRSYREGSREKTIKFSLTQETHAYLHTHTHTHTACVGVSLCVSFSQIRASLNLAEADVDTGQLCSPHSVCVCYVCVFVLL